MVFSIEIILKIFLGLVSYYTVYSGKLQDIAIALSIAETWHDIQKAIIFTDNQDVSWSFCNLGRQLGQ